jgi:hypothetical protein
MDAVVTTILAILAFLLSLYTLWATQLKGFQPLFLLRGPSLRFVKFKREVGTSEQTLKVVVWYPILDCTITAFNRGVQPGQIIRLYAF